MEEAKWKKCSQAHRSRCQQISGLLVGEAIDSVNVQAHAKINLHLEVIRKRKDGYHEIETLFHSLTLHDDIEIRKRCNAGIRIDCNNARIPLDKRNLAYQAADLFCQQMLIKNGINIKIKKRIPIASGLAGGSADAAAVLQGMNRLFEVGLGIEDLKKMGVKLGADVPFCLTGGAAIGYGIGEILTTISPLENVPILLVNPGLEISAASAYQGLDLRHSRQLRDVRISAKYVEEGNLAGVSQSLYNCLERSVFQPYPAISILKEELGCLSESYGSLMSGSGATVFAIMTNDIEAIKSSEVLKRKFPICIVARTSPFGLKIA